MTSIFRPETVITVGQSRYPSTWYWADTSFYAKTVSVAADRYTVLTPNAMQIDIGGTSYTLTSQQSIDLSVAANWDSSTYATAANRAGLDFYIYAIQPGSGSVPSFKLSTNSTTPSGYTAGNSRKVAGFHCLAVAVGTISGHALTGYVVGDILPASVWDLKFRPFTTIGGMVYDSQIDLWVMVYLQSGTGTSTRSANGATITDTRMWYDHADDCMAVGCFLPDNQEFQSFSRGANQETNITGSADPGTTTGHTDTAGRRMISDIGCEDCCGVMWQWLRDQTYRYDSATWSWYDIGSKGSVYQQGGYGDVRVIAGGYWGNGVICGSRSRALGNYGWFLYSFIGARGVARCVRS